MNSNLIVTLLCKQTTFSDDKVEGGTGHQHTMTHVPKHHSKQKRKGDDGVGCYSTQKKTIQGQANLNRISHFFSLISGFE